MSLEIDVHSSITHTEGDFENMMNSSIDEPILDLNKQSNEISNVNHFLNNSNTEKIYNNITLIKFPISRLKVLGKGSSSVVYKSVLLHKLCVTAEKVFLIGDETKRNQLYRELELLKSSNGDIATSNRNNCCPYLINLLEIYSNPIDGTLSMCLEFMNKGSLQDIIDQFNGCQDEIILSSIAFQMTSGLKYLHDRKLIHRDVKPSNVLISSSGCIKLADFGLLRTLDQDQSFADSFVGSFLYMSPERLTGEPYSYSADIWGLGITLYTLVLGHYPYINQESGLPQCGYWELLQATQSSPPKLPFSHSHSVSFQDFLRQACLPCTVDRATSIALLTHSFLKAKLHIIPLTHIHYLFHPNNTNLNSISPTSIDCNDKISSNHNQELVSSLEITDLNKDHYVECTPVKVLLSEHHQYHHSNSSSKIVSKRYGTSSNIAVIRRIKDNRIKNTESSRTIANQVTHSGVIVPDIAKQSYVMNKNHLLCHSVSFDSINYINLHSKQEDLKRITDKTIQSNDFSNSNDDNIIMKLVQDWNDYIIQIKNKQDNIHTPSSTYNNNSNNNSGNLHHCNNMTHEYNHTNPIQPIQISSDNNNNPILISKQYSPIKSTLDFIKSPMSAVKSLRKLVLQSYKHSEFNTKEIISITDEQIQLLANDLNCDASILKYKFSSILMNQNNNNNYNHNNVGDNHNNQLRIIPTSNNDNNNHINSNNDNSITNQDNNSHNDTNIILSTCKIIFPTYLENNEQVFNNKYSITVIEEVNTRIFSNNNINKNDNIIDSINHIINNTNDNSNTNNHNNDIILADEISNTNT